MWSYSTISDAEISNVAWTVTRASSDNQNLRACLIQSITYGEHTKSRIIMKTLGKYEKKMCDFRLPLRSRSELCSSSYYASSSGNSLQTFRDNLSVPSSRVKNTNNLHPLRGNRWFVPKRRWGITTTRCIITHKRAVLKKSCLSTGLPPECLWLSLG